MSDSISGLKDEAIFGLFDQLRSEPLTTAEVATKAGYSYQTAYNKLDSLVNQGFLKTKEVGASGRVWWCPVPERKHDESEERQASNLAATKQLQEISTQLIQEDNIDALYQKILDAAVTIMDADCGSMQLRDADRAELQLLAHRGFSPEAAEFWQSVRSESNSTCGVALDTGERTITPDVETCEFMAGTEDREMYLQTGIRAVQTTPLVSRNGDVLGMISTHWRNPHEPSEQKLRLLDVLARQAADLIERTQSEKALHDNEALLAGQKRALEQLAHGAGLNDVLATLIRVIEDYCDGVRGSILVCQPDEEQFDMAVAPNLPQQYTETLQHASYSPPYLGPCGKATHEGETVVSDDIETDMRWASEWRDLAVESGLHSCHSTPIEGTDGKVRGSFGLYSHQPGDVLPDQAILDAVTDIAGVAIERTESEDALREREEHLSALVETTPECIKTVGADGTLLQMNSAGLDVVEADSASDVIGESVYGLIAPEHREKFREFNEWICQGESGILEFDIISLEGVRRHMETHAAPLRRPDGTINQLALTRDITEQVERERELERARDMLAKTERIADVGGWEIDVDTREVFWTDHIFELLEVDSNEEPPLEEALGMYHEEDQPIVKDVVEEALDTGDPFDVEVRVRTDSGEVRWLRLQGVPKTVADAVISLRGAAQDITERKQREQRLKELIDDLEESNDRLEQFAYAASHDLQEPLRMVSSYLQLIEHRYADDLDKDGEEFLEFAIDGSERMRSMIQGLLKYSRVETRGDSFEPIDLDAVLADVCEDLQLRIEESNTEINADSLPRVNGDEEQLRQVFQNLLDNAIEYSGDESPQVDISAERDGAKWIVSVSDKGVGIDSDDPDRVFEVFQSLHPPDEHAGTGIGLALCERIVERHGGEIWVESEPDKGSTFSFPLPAVSDHTK